MPAYLILALLLGSVVHTVAFSTVSLKDLFRVNTFSARKLSRSFSNRGDSLSGSISRGRDGSFLLSPSMSLEPTSQEKVDEVDLIKVFGRLAEKTLFGDGSAGQCCHSGCSDCEWRYSFDILQSARPKWIPSYRYFYRFSTILHALL